MAAAFILLAASGEGMADVTGNANVGQEIATRECSGCHGTGVAHGVTIQGVYVPSFSEIAGKPNQTRERLKAFLMMPHRPMPGIPLGESEVRNLVEYTISFKH